MHLATLLILIAAISAAPTTGPTGAGAAATVEKLNWRDHEYEVIEEHREAVDDYFRELAANLEMDAQEYLDICLKSHDDLELSDEDKKIVRKELDKFLVADKFNSTDQYISTVKSRAPKMFNIFEIRGNILDRKLEPLSDKARDFVNWSVRMFMDILVKFSQKSRDSWVLDENDTLQIDFNVEFVTKEYNKLPKSVLLELEKTLCFEPTMGGLVEDQKELANSAKLVENESIA